MGWIANRKMRTGNGIAYGHTKSIRASAPLRKIIGFEAEGDNSLFGRGDLMLLECGHKVFTKGSNKARCTYCKKLKH